jgi:hypothetical protein
MALSALLVEHTDLAIIVMQSAVLHAGTRPTVEIVPRVGFKPTTPLNADGTRVLPAVSVATVKETMFAATLTTDPEELPPET